MRHSFIVLAPFRLLAAALAACSAAGHLAAQEHDAPAPIESLEEVAGIASYPEYSEYTTECGGCDCPVDACGCPAEFCTYFEPPGTYWDGDTRHLRSHFLGRLWAEGEYLAWSARQTYLPPLISAGAATPAFGDTKVHGDLRSGGRLTAGYWFTPEHCAGLEANFFEVDGLNIEFDAFNDGVTELSRPIINAMTGAPDTVPITGQYPGYTFQSVSVRSDVDFLGSELSWRQIMRCDAGHRLDWVAGYRYARLYDGLSVDEAHTRTEILDGGAIRHYLRTRSDWFRSENEFHGGQFGLIGRWWGCRWALQTLGKVAVGGTRTGAIVDGSVTTIDSSDPDTPDVRHGGVLALPSNIGTYGTTELAAVLELGIRLEYALCRQWRATLGYTYLFWSSVSRIPDSIDLVVDTSQIWSGGAVRPPSATATRPAFGFESHSFWTHGLSVGLHYDF